MASLSNLCALAIVPPKQHWSRIQQLRRLHDKNAERWPPHINIAFPFIEPQTVSKSLPILQSILRRFPSFEICFTKFSWLEPTQKQKGKSRVWHYLEPNEQAALDIKKLTRLIYNSELRLGEQRSLPPHMSIGQTTLAEAPSFNHMLNEKFETEEPISFRVDKIFIMARTHNTNGKIIKKIMLKQQEP